MSRDPNKIAIELNPRFLVISLVVLAIFIGIFGGQVLFGNRSANTGHVITGQRVLLPEAGDALISGVLCPCGRCEDMLAICVCETAIDIKNTINRLFAQNKSKTEMKEALMAKYGEKMFNYAKN